MSSTNDPTAPGVSGASSASSNGGRLGPDHLTDDQAPPEALKDISNRLSELGEYVSYYLGAKVDGIKVSLRNAGIWAGLGVIGLMAGGAFVVTLVVLLLRGIAGGIGAMFNPDRPWAGELITAVLFLTALGIGVMIAMKKLTASSRERTAKKYAARQQQERVKFGTDVHQRAQDPAE
jgi:Putative Actinobacterial Holin-X, holin superfamily III